MKPERSQPDPPGADFLPYGRQTIEEDDIAAVVRVLESDHLTTGPTVDRFEQALATAVGAEWAVAVSSGTAALHAACAAAGVSEGDEVIVPALTFVATANCARFLGAEPIFADVDPDTGLIRPAEVARLAGPRTKAVIPVHLTGTSADIAAIREALGRREVTMIEDATHALGGVRGSSPVGACSDGPALATFSFHPVKNIATGEGGAITGRDRVLEGRLRRFRSHGIVREQAEFATAAPGPWYYEQQTLGHNLRLSDIHASLGVTQLAKLDRFLAKRRALAARYDTLLEGVAGVQPVTAGPERRSSAYHLYCVLVDFESKKVSRAELMSWLKARGFGTQVHYIPLPEHPYYAARGWNPSAFPGARRYYSRTLSLPIFPGMDEADVDRVVTALVEGLEALTR